LLRRNPSPPGHYFRCSSKSPHFPYIGSCNFQTAFTPPLFFRFLSQLDLRSVLDLRQASIDGEIYTGDERTFIGAEEYDGSCDFLGLAPATLWDRRGDL